MKNEDALEEEIPGLVILPNNNMASIRPLVPANNTPLVPANNSYLVPANKAGVCSKEPVQCGFCRQWFHNRDGHISEYSDNNNTNKKNKNNNNINGL